MIHRRAAVKNQDVLEALGDIAEQVLLAVGRVREVLQGKERDMGAFSVTISRFSLRHSQV